jgi:D-serine deaminase-like pyridoxal phosphate-dependent protein
LVDSAQGVEAARRELGGDPANLRYRVDLDSGFGRTGVPVTEAAVAVDLALALDGMGRFAGWHLYDGHVKGSRDERRTKVLAEARAIAVLNERLQVHGLSADLAAGGSYTFDLWPADVARFVSPGSWTYSSAQHDVELTDLGWEPAAFVLSTVISAHGGTITLDAGAKAVAPDKPMKERFRCAGEILLMSEEHTVVRTDGLSLGDRVLLLPQHACTTAYLYDRALVRTSDGKWEIRRQLGGTR